MYEPITPARTYVLVGVVLLIFTFLTVMASTLNLGVFHTPVALGFAVAKASLIALFFMNARYSKGITRMVIFIGVLWLGIMFAGTMHDVLTRGWLPVPGH